MKKTGDLNLTRDRSQTHLLRAVDLSDRRLVIHDEVRILEATIELLSGLFLIAVALVIPLSIFGSVVVALCAVIPGEMSRGKTAETFGDSRTPSSEQCS